MRKLLLVTLLLASPALADGVGVPNPDTQALGQMLGEAQLREARALAQAYTLRGEVTRLQRQVDDLQAENAKLKDAAKPAPSPNP